MAAGAACHWTETCSGDGKLTGLAASGSSPAHLSFHVALGSDGTDHPAAQPLQRMIVIRTNGPVGGRVR
jgi:hypothetical protein